MRLLLVFIINLLLIVSAYAQDGYISMEEYFSSHPNEREKSRSFDTIVSSPSSPLSKPQDKKIKIALIYPGLQISDYWQRSLASFEKRLQELGVAYELSARFTPPDTNIDAQLEHIVKEINNDTDYLVFTLTTKRHEKVIEQLIREKNIKLILQNITTPIRRLGANQPFLYVGFDHFKGTKLLADYFLKEFKNGANYGVLFLSTDGYISKARGDYFIELASENKKIKLLDSYYVGIDFNKSYHATKEMIENHDDIDFIYACSTDVAFGAAKAIKQSGKNIKINGWGGGKREIAAIKDKILDVTVVRHNDDNGIAMAEAIKLDIEGKGSKVPLIYSGRFSLIDTDTPQNEIDSLEKEIFKYSKECCR